MTGVTERYDWDRILEQLNEEDRENGWVSLAEASSATGASLSSLRSWYRSGQIRSRMVAGVHGPERRVQLDEVLARSLRSARLSRQADRARSVESVLEDLVARVAAIEARLGITGPPGYPGPPPGP
ncbi:MAG: excisionase [Acidimicrobiales bacterium]